ncbi:MAG: methylisocitrate lyase [Nitrososphaerales archaeon]
MRESSGDAPARLRKLILHDGCTAVPGVFSPSVALLAAEAGFKGLYFSGAAFSGLLGLPDLGVTTLTEVADAVSRITSQVDLPMIVDVDTGFGEAVNMARTVAVMERANAAAIQVEDQVMPKRCGHLDGKQLVSEEEMSKKLIAARDAMDRGLVIVARTDAASVEGIDAAVERARLYVRAGADVIFPEALRNRAEFREFAKKVDSPLLANMTEFGKTEYIPVREFGKLGYKFVIFPVTMFRVMMKSVQEALGELALKGTQEGLLERMMDRSEFYDLIGYSEYESADRRTVGKAKKLLDTN